MFTIYYLLIAFAAFGFMDIAGKNRISIRYLIAFSFISVALSILSKYYIANLGGYYLYAVIASAVLLYLLPRLGLGDKIFLSSLLLLYPVWFVWALIIIALMLAWPILVLIARFSKRNKIEVPFYPFLFISASILLIALTLLYYY